MLGVANALSPDRGVILIGHDWGAPTVYGCALIHPDRCLALATLSIAYQGVPERDFAQVMKQLFDAKDRFFYQSYFQEVGKAEAIYDADPRNFLRRFYYALAGDAAPGSWPMRQPASFALLDGLPDPAVFPAWMSTADLDHYTREFARSGFFGPISRYRNHTRDFHFLQPYRERKIHQPACFIVGDRDIAFNMFQSAVDPLDEMRRCLTNLEAVHILEGCGHWTQQERPDAVTGLLVAWLNSLRGRVL